MGPSRYLKGHGRDSKALGVRLCDSTAVHLLNRLPSLDESVGDSVSLSMSPSKSFLFRLHQPYRDPEWVERDYDWSPGLYRYKARTW